MGLKFALALLCIVSLQGPTCEAGKAFGGMGGPGGAGGFGGFSLNIGLINQERLKLVSAQRIVNMTADATNTSVQNNIAAAQASIDAEILASQNKAKGVNNPVCVNQHTAALSQVNSESVKACDQADQFKDLKLKVPQLAGFHVRISACYTLCPIFAPPDCVTNLLVGIDTEINDLQTSLLEDIANIQKDSDDCIVNATTDAHNAIAAADAALQQCAQSTAA